MRTDVRACAHTACVRAHLCLRRQFVVVTVQTASKSRALRALESQHFELCVVDEAHHTAADTWLRVLFHLGFICEQVGASAGVLDLHRNMVWRCAHIVRCRACFRLELRLAEATSMCVVPYVLRRSQLSRGNERRRLRSCRTQTCKKAKV